jgi:hypothetical protein
MEQWIEKACRDCREKFFVNSRWKKRPTTCSRCRARSASGIILLLRQYLLRMRGLEQIAKSNSDLCAINKDKAIREKVEAIFHSQGSQQETIEELVEDKQIRSLILRLDKERRMLERIENRSRAQSGETAAFKVFHIIYGS